MAHGRRERGFERAGTCGPQRLGLSAARATELRLAVAWNDAAGSEIARRATAVRVRAGVLEVEVDDPRWVDAVQDLLPRLAGRVAARDASLGVQRCRLVERAGPRSRRGPVRGIERDPEVPARRARGRAETDAGLVATRPSRDEIESRLRDAAERHLARRRAGVASDLG